MKKTRLFFVLLLQLLLIINCLYAQVAENPLRGLYIDKFAKYTGSSYNNAFSILGVDQNNDGVFEKEEEVLVYAQQNHFTTIILYDLNNVFRSSAPLVWNKNDSRNESLQEHLCRFMMRARTYYGITRILAAVGGAGTAQDVEDFNDMFSTPTPPVLLNPSQANLQANPRLLILNQQYNIGDPMLIYSEVAKFALRVSSNSLSCGATFDGFVTEYEFWVDELPDNDLLVPPYEQLMLDLNIIASNSSPALIITVYYGKNALSSNHLTCPTCPTEFTDGTNSAIGGSCNYCLSGGTNHARQANEIFLEEYYRSTSSFGNGVIDNEGAFKALNTRDQTIIRPIFSAESKLYGANDNFFGEWMLKTTNANNQIRNIFVAEKEHYVVWSAQKVSTTNENILAPGSYNWFTSSYLLRSFKNPPLFYTNAPICSTQINSPLSVSYIGPREKNIYYELKLTDVNSSVVTITNGYTPDFTINQTDFLAAATSALTVTSANAPYVLTLELNYGNGTPIVTYSEVIQVSNSLKATPIGYNSLTNISICGSQQVLLKASATSNIDWYKDGIKVAQGGTGGEQYFNVKESGSYYAVKTSGSGCPGTSNTINIVGFDQSVFISPICSTATNLKLNANYTSNVFNPGNFQYKWNTGATSQLLEITSDQDDNRIFSVEVSNPNDNCIAFNSISIPKGDFNFTSETISASAISCNAGFGSVQLTVTGTEYPKTMVSDGVVNRFITWFGAPVISPQTLTLLPPGHYQVTVINNGNSCNDNITFDIGTAVNFLNTNSVTNLTCNGSSNGSATFSATNTSLNLTFEWIGVPANSITKTNSSTTANNLRAGVYTLKITENGTCNYQYINFTISQPSGYSSSATSNIILCNGAATGSINQTVSPSPVSFSWSNSAVTEDISGLVAGTYSCTVTSSTGCSQTFQYNVDQNPAPSLTETHTNVCNSGTNGSATVTALNGMAPYTYLWSPSGGNAATANNLAAGNYSCIVIDVNGCTKSISVVISSSGTATVDAGSDQIVCGNSTTLAGSNPSPGNGTWTIVSGTGGSIFNASDPATAFSGTLGNIYILRWTVNNPTCSSNVFDQVSIEFKNQPTISNAGTNQTVCGTTTTLNANSPTIGVGSWSIVGVGSGTFSNPSSSSSNFTGTIGTTYVLRWTISNAPCTESFDEVSVTLNPVPTVNVSAQNQSCPGLNDGSATATTSPFGTYLYSWSCTPATTPSVSGLAVGSCNVTVTNTSTSCVSAPSVFNINAAVPICSATFHTCASPLNSSSQFGSGFIGTSGNRATVAIHSDFTINNNFEFRFADITIDPNIKIIVAASCTLTIHNTSHLFACTNMWDGIYLSSPSSVLIIDGSTIEDACKLYSPAMVQNLLFQVHQLLTEISYPSMPKMATLLQAVYQARHSNVLVAH